MVDIYVLLKEFYGVEQVYFDTKIREIYGVV
jgi:hypothetical protein